MDKIDDNFKYVGNFKKCFWMDEGIVLLYIFSHIIKIDCVNQNVILQYWTELKGKARSYNAQNSQLLKRTGNPTDKFPDYDPILERVLNVMGRNHMNRLQLIPEIASGSIGQQPKTSQYIFNI